MLYGTTISRLASMTSHPLENLRFIPLQPVLEISMVLGWKKEQIFSAATAAFIDFAKCSKSISNDKI